MILRPALSGDHACQDQCNIFIHPSLCRIALMHLSFTGLFQLAHCASHCHGGICQQCGIEVKMQQCQCHTLFAPACKVIINYTLVKPAFLPEALFRDGTHCDDGALQGVQTLGDQYYVHHHSKCEYACPAPNLFISMRNEMAQRRY